MSSVPEVLSSPGDEGTQAQSREAAPAPREDTNLLPAARAHLCIPQMFTQRLLLPGAEFDAKETV